MWYAILLAGGSGERMKAGRNKILLPLCGEAVIARSARAFAGLVDGMIVVVRQEDEADIRSALEAAALPFPVSYAYGGTTRQASVWNGLMALPDCANKVLIHDGARCLVDAPTIERVKDSVDRCGSGIASIAAVDTIKVADTQLRAIQTPDRASLRCVQTPQGFTVDLIRSAHLQAQSDGFLGTDDASLVEHMGQTVQLTEGSRRNLKLTTPEDMAMAETFLHSGAAYPLLRVGQGYDVHRLVEGRDLILCGVKVPHTLGLLGHSDADVALHALMDAMLGAAALGDIGKHFPDTDPQYKGISSMKLLEHVTALLRTLNFRVANADVTIIAQKPKLLTYIPQMRENIAKVLSLPPERVNVKATTTERLSFEGREEGISAQAICMLQEI